MVDLVEGLTIEVVVSSRSFILRATSVYIYGIADKERLQLSADDIIRFGQGHPCRLWISYAFSFP